MPSKPTQCSGWHEYTIDGDTWRDSAARRWRQERCKGCGVLRRLVSGRQATR